MKLYAHPFSSYCQKVLIALYENATPFEYRNLEDASANAELAALWPLKRFPVLVDRGKTILETTTIIEHLQIYYAGTVRLIPGGDTGVEVRMLDRIFDNYVMDSMQKIVLDKRRAEADRDAYGVNEARGVLDKMYSWLNERLAGRTWAAGAEFTLADCAAAPALFYADWAHEIPADLANLRAYRARLLARPSVARAVDEARPFRKYFPLGGAGSRLISAMTLDEYKRQYEKADTGPGWAAIDSCLESIYPEQEPRHFAPPVPALLGGSEPLDGISLYKSTSGAITHDHLVTYGFSELYFDESVFGKEFSRFGFELTFRPKRTSGSGEPYWAVNMLQNIAKYVFKSGNWFEPFDVLPSGPIRIDVDTALRALLFVPDPELGPVDTPHGKLQFLQVFGITEKELAATERLYDKAVALADWHRKINPFFVTVLERKDL